MAIGVSRAYARDALGAAFNAAFGPTTPNVLLFLYAALFYTLLAA